MAPLSPPSQNRIAVSRLAGQALTLTRLERSSFKLSPLRPQLITSPFIMKLTTSWVATALV